MTFLPYSLLSNGISGALEALSSGHGRGKRTAQIIGSFLGYGVAMAILGTSICLALAFWVFGQLPVYTEKPWWAIF